MLSSTLAVLSALITLAFASPIPQGPNSLVPRRKFKSEDVAVLNFAVTAEWLEANYYTWGLNQWSQQDFDKAGLPKEARGLFEEIRDHEIAHAKFITAAIEELGAVAVKAGTYSFPVKTVEQFVAFSGVLEQIGASAYSGFLGLVSSADFVEHGATVLAIEARQSAYVRHINGPSPFPAIFETPLTPSQVFSLASPLIVSQPKSNPTDFIAALDIVVLPQLTVAVAETPTKIGSEIKVAYKGYTTSDKVYAIFLSEGYFFIADVQDGYTTVPDGVAAGQIYVFVSKSNSYSKDDGNALTGVAVLDIAQS